MTDLETTLLTSALTVLVGVAIFVSGQIILKFFIEPVHELRKAIAAVRYTLLYFAPDILTPIGRTPESSTLTRNALLKNSADLFISCEAVRWYPRMSRLAKLPAKAEVLDAAKWLRGLSTYMRETGEEAEGHIEQVNGSVTRIERSLNLPALLQS